MTDDLYSTRLRYNGKNGVAKLHGKAVPFYGGPDLGDGRVWMCDYRPEVGMALVQPRSIDKPRDMTLEERQAADALLRALVEAA